MLNTNNTASAAQPVNTPPTSPLTTEHSRVGMDTAITQQMTDNMKGKFSCLADQLPGMTVHAIDTLQYVDSGMQSDTFNTVFGMPTSADDIRTITQYYQQQNKPAAWWFAGSPVEYQAALQDAGWKHEENNQGIYLGLSTLPAKPNPVLSHIERSDNKNCFQDFSRVLSAIFEPDNPTEAENIRNIYQRAGEHSANLADNLIHMVGYLDSEPVATAAVYLKNNVAGIFDVATSKAQRHRGVGHEMVYQALLVAQQKGATICVLQVLPKALSSYTKFGFMPLGNFEVWNLSNNR